MKKLILLSMIVSSSAFAQAKGGAAAGAPAVPAAKPAEAKIVAPPEVAERAKGMTGTWKCAGKAELGTTTVDIKGTAAHKTDLDGFWIATTLTINAPKETFHVAMWSTYDADAKKWYRTGANSHGGHSTEWGTVSDKKVSWDGDAHYLGKDVKVRETEEMTSPKEVHIVGEYSTDGAKTWKPDHDVTCKK